MNFERLLREALGQLPGPDAQMRMSPNPRMPWDPTKFADGGRDAAALLFLYPHDGHWHLPLTVRGSGLRDHTGQVSLPGGRVDAGETIEGAAIREAAEEVGIPAHTVRIVGQLTPVQIPVSGYVLHPVVGLADERPVFRLDEWEVARLIEVRLDDLRDHAIVGRTTRRREFQGLVEEIEVPFFGIDGEEVWGATAMVLSEFLAVLESFKLDDRGGRL
jgi:8-oxo-dGTP pyrophosphatase MutT (NUDIX family)